MNIQDISIENIIPYARNPRKNDDAITKVASSIKEYGFKQPIVVDKDMVIIAGHTRYQAAKKLGYETVPVLIASDLTEAQAKAYRIADNKTGEYAEWDYDLLKLEFDELVDIDFDLSETGFIKNELEDILNINDDEDKYTTKITTPIYEITGIKPNITDLYQINKTESLIDEINKSGIDENIKKFLIYSSYRHIIFNYENIAEYYAHSDEKIKKLMEKSALVIIDYDKAIENGYIELSKKIMELSGKETDD